MVDSRSEAVEKVLNFLADHKPTVDKKGREFPDCRVIIIMKTHQDAWLFFEKLISEAELTLRERFPDMAIMTSAMFIWMNKESDKRRHWALKMYSAYGNEGLEAALRGIHSRDLLIMYDASVSPEIKNAAKMTCVGPNNHALSL